MVERSEFSENDEAATCQQTMYNNITSIICPRTNNTVQPN